MRCAAFGDRTECVAATVAAAVAVAETMGEVQWNEENRIRT